MTQNEVKQVEKIKGQYNTTEKKVTELDKLKELDKKVKRPIQIFSYSFGTASSLILGTGMTMAMSLIPGGMIAGIAIGALGICGAGANYKLHDRLMKKRKQKYSKEVIELSETILNENK